MITPALRAPLAGRRLLAVAALVTAALAVASIGYGYHRDELYFIAIGRHPAFGYVDEPPLVPLVAHALDAVSGHSLFWLRFPSALAGGVIVLLTGVIAREFGGDRTAQVFAAVCAATSSIVLAVSHMMSTSTFDLLGWTVITWLVVRALRDNGPVWLALGVAAGVDLEVKTLPVFLLFALLVGVLAVGPRDVLRSRWLWGGALIALALWLPNLVWQATHHWPQITLAHAIANGSSGSSQPRSLFIPFQFLLAGPVLTPVWIAGLVRLARNERFVRWRSVAVAYPVLAVIFLVTDGKPYYLCGLYPVLLAAGAEPTLVWLRRTRARAIAFAALLAIGGAVSAVVVLPIVPVASLHNTPVVAMNYDAGETVGWPRFAGQVAAVYDALPAAQRAQAAVITANYGEAGALLRYRPDVRPVYGAQNSLWSWGPPTSGTTTVISLGFSRTELAAWFTSVQPAGRIDNGVALDNDEQGRTIWLCAGPRGPWPQLWKDMRQLG